MLHFEVLSSSQTVQTDTTFLNVVMSSQAEGGQCCESLMILRKIQLTQKGNLLNKKLFTGSMQYLTHNHSFKTCGGPEALVSTAIFMKCVF